MAVPRSSVQSSKINMTKTDRKKRKLSNCTKMPSVCNVDEVITLCSKSLVGDINSPEIIITEDRSNQPELRRRLLGKEIENSCTIFSTENRNEEETTVNCSISSKMSCKKKRKSLNDSVVILCEVNRENNLHSAGEITETLHIVKRRCIESHLSVETSNDSVISVHDVDEDDDDDVTVVSNNSDSGVHLKEGRENTASDDIILLDCMLNSEKQQSESIPLPNTSRTATCTVTSSDYIPLKHFSSLGSPSSQPVFVDAEGNSDTAEAASGSTDVPLFTVDRTGSQFWHRFRRHPQNSKTDSNVYGSNIYNPNPQQGHRSKGLRPIIIDGSNVAIGHSSRSGVFSSRGLQICINYFVKRGHHVIAFVPHFRKHLGMVSDRHILLELEKSGKVVFTPSRKVDGRLVVPYDDRYIVQCAAEFGGVIVSTDNYRDLLHENEAWRETIEQRLLMFTWVGDLLMFPLDPLGRDGPKLDEFLRFPK